jgi:hypothetical protein
MIPWRTLLLPLLLVLSGQVLAGVPEGWRLQGAGEMRWFGFKLYDARFWLPPGAGADMPAAMERPFALELRYAREIPSQKLVEASVDEMQRLGESSPERLGAWREALARVFPDVRPGDTIVGLNRGDGSADFFHQGRPTGRLADAALVRRFFAIWLDPKTREPSLRASLLGQ